jgi:uncharacterized protein (TIGR02246 family)
MANQFRSGFLPLATALLLAATAAPVPAETVDPKLEQAVHKANADWATAVKTGDAAAIAAPYADDAVFVLGDGTCRKGRAEIEKMYRDGFERGGVATSARIDSKKLVVDGDLAYESGYGQIGRTKSGKAVTSGGRYLTVWQRASDGAWTIIRNIVLP